MDVEQMALPQERFQGTGLERDSVLTTLHPLGVNNTDFLFQVFLEPFVCYGWHSPPEGTFLRCLQPCVVRAGTRGSSLLRGRGQYSNPKTSTKSSISLCS